MLPHTKELSQAEHTVFDRDELERELRRRAFRIETLPPIASGLNGYRMKPLTDILCHGNVITGVDISEQTARTIILASHSRYQEDALRLAPYSALQSQIIELNAYFQQQSSTIEQLMGQVANVLGNLENIASQSQKDTLPIPKVYLPEVETWAQVLALHRMDDSSLKSEFTFRDLVQGGTQSSVIIGKGGSGKTTTLQMIAHTLLVENATEVYCVWIPLRSYAHSLANTIKHSVGWSGIVDEQAMGELGKRRAILLLDGLNEVAEGLREQCAAEIELLMRSYEGQLIVSYTDVDQPYFAFDCPAYELLPLTEKQVRAIIEKFYAEKQQLHKAEQFLARMTGESVQSSSDFFSFVKTPLNLGLLLELEEDISLNSIRDLYRQVLEQRLKRTQQRGKTGQIPTNVKIECLADLAFQSMTDDHSLQMTKAYVIDVFSNRLSAVESGQSLDEITRSGLLNENDGYVEWFHASCRDYLVGYRLIALSDKGKSLQEFPLDKPQWSAAVAYAIGLSTLPTVDLAKRPLVLQVLLQKGPTFESVRVAMAEYHFAHMVLDCQDWECAKSNYETMNWGRRFLIAYERIADMARREGFLDNLQIPRPRGLTVLFSSVGDLVVMLYSDKNEIRFGDLDGFNSEVAKVISQHVECVGFCFHGKLLPTIDPEVIAYIQVGVWLKLRSKEKDHTRLNRWHRDISAYSVRTPNDWTRWRIDRLPEPQNASSVWRERLLLSWDEILVPITFQVDPFQTSAQPTVFSNRLSQVIIGTKPASQISLALLMSGSLNAIKLDLDTGAFVPFPIPLLHRYYSVLSV